MIKKFIMFAAIGLLLGGMAWAQTAPVADDAWLSAFDNRANFGWIPNLSTEARFTAGVFQGDADRFIDPTSFSALEDGTLLFVGASPRPTPSSPTYWVGLDADYQRSVNLGFATTVAGIYLGVYYSGGWNAGLANGGGFRFRDTAPDTEVDSRRSDTTWNNHLALLIGLTNMGFRFDLSGFENNSTRRTIDGELAQGESRTVTNAPALSLTWGASINNLSPFVTIGYRFSDLTVWADGNGNAEERHTSGGVFGISAGVELAIGAAGEEEEASAAFGAELRFATRVADTWSFEGAGMEDVRAGGAWGLGLNLYYAHELEFGIASLGFSPNMDIAIAGINNNNSLVAENYMVPNNNHFSLNTGIAVGLKIQPEEGRLSNFAFHTGTTLELFQWNTAWHSDNDAQALNRSAWTFTGLDWLGGFDIGMTFKPSETLVLGAGISNILTRYRTNSTAPLVFDFTITARLGG